jgi:hypothetical protein
VLQAGDYQIFNQVCPLDSDPKPQIMRQAADHFDAVHFRLYLCASIAFAVTACECETKLNGA